MKQAAMKDHQAFVFLIYCCWECKMLELFWKTIWQFLTKLNIVLPYNPAIGLLDIYPNELKPYVQIKNCT